ncbi:MAG: S8 family serine peptidase, partial [Anaerolineae bacterium]
VVPVPEGVNLRFRDLPGDGTPETLLIGAAPGAKVVAIRRGGTLVSESTYIYAAFGHENQRPGDELQVLSNSYRLENHFHEGWDYTSRLVDYLTSVNPNISYLWSSGNGGPGYGSIRDPNPKSGIKVAASTQMGSTGYDSITETTQITWGDLISFSSFGPGSDGTIGPHVAASGAYATGAVGVNARLDGRMTTVTWGGTSRSTPVAAGNLSLVYQAFKEKNGRWPTWREARSILMAGSQFMGYDPYLYGAGVIDGGASAYIAGGAGGVYAMPAILKPGDYRGTTYSAFPKLTAPGNAEAMDLTIINPGTDEAELTLKGQRPRMVGTHEFTWQSKPSTGESAYYYHHPDYVIPIPRDVIPPGTEMMAVRMILPLEDMDLNLNYRGPGADNIWYMRAYQHTDIDGDGNWWDDADGDGIVDHRRLATSSQLDGILDFDWSGTELDRWEFMRIGQDTAPTNNKLLWIHHPLERWASGLYIGLVHASRPSARPVTTMRFRLEFYRYEDWPWIDVAEESVTVPAGGSTRVPVIVHVPADADYGYHQGAVFGLYAADTPDASPYHRLTVPVQVNVGAIVDAGGTGAARHTLYLPTNRRGPAAAAGANEPRRPVDGEPPDGRGWRSSRSAAGPGGQPSPGPGRTIVLGGEGAQDAADPYPNGLVRGL